jgi:hypothetical protein
LILRFFVMRRIAHRVVAISERHGHQQHLLNSTILSEKNTSISLRTIAALHTARSPIPIAITSTSSPSTSLTSATSSTTATTLTNFTNNSRPTAAWQQHRWLATNTTGTGTGATNDGKANANADADSKGDSKSEGGSDENKGAGPEETEFIKEDQGSKPFFKWGFAILSIGGLAYWYYYHGRDGQWQQSLPGFITGGDGSLIMPPLMDPKTRTIVVNFEKTMGYPFWTVFIYYHSYYATRTEVIT